MTASQHIRALVGLLVLFAVPHMAAGGTCRLDERVVVHPPTAAEIVLTITTDHPDDLPPRIPFDRGTPRGAMICSDGGVVVAFTVQEGIPFLTLAGTPTGPGPYTVTVVVDTFPGWATLKAGEFGNRTFSFVFRNSTTTRIAEYTGTVLLPEGLTVTSVVSSEPAQTEKEPAAPFAVFSRGSRTGISIHAADLELADGARVTFRCKPTSKSPVLFAVCSLVGILYLIFFRNVLKDNGNGSPAA